MDVTTGPGRPLLRMAGLTLLETVVTVGIVGIVVGIGAPAMSASVEQWNARAATHRLTTSLATARLLAVTRNRPVSLCPSSGDGRCTLDGTWHRGWMIYLDTARSDQPRLPDDIVELQPGLRGDLTLRTSVARPRIRFQPDGRSSGATATFSLCKPSDARLLARVVLNNAGRARTEHHAVQDASCL